MGGGEEGGDEGDEPVWDGAPGEVVGAAGVGSVVLRFDQEAELAQAGAGEEVGGVAGLVDLVGETGRGFAHADVILEAVVGFEAEIEVADVDGALVGVEGGLDPFAGGWVEDDVVVPVVLEVASGPIDEGGEAEEEAEEGEGVEEEAEGALHE